MQFVIVNMDTHKVVSFHKSLLGVLDETKDCNFEWAIFSCIAEHSSWNLR